MTIGEKIRWIRNVRGLTQKELGNRIHLSGDRIRQYENNIRTPKVNMRKRLADALEVDVSALSNPDPNSNVGILRILFEWEDSKELLLCKNGNTYSFTFGKESLSGRELNQFLACWYQAQQKAVSASEETEMSIQKKWSDYQSWKWQFPKGCKSRKIQNQRKEEFDGSTGR